MLSFLIFLAVLLLIIKLLSGNRTNNTSDTDNDRDNQWLTYLESFRNVVRSKAEKSLIDNLIAGTKASDLYSNPKTIDQSISQPSTNIPIPLASPTDQPTQQVKPKEPIDNTLILLYFGGFLLVASAGLFTAFSSTNNVLRTFILALCTLVLYLGGIWIYKTRPKLRDAGISFIGTGLVIAPLVGIAWYNLIANQSDGRIIWTVTSLICLALYFHAHKTVGNSFTNYLMIGSFVSTVESSVLLANLPTYGFVWGLVFCSLALEIFSWRKKNSNSVMAPANLSAQFLTPLSILSSIILLPTHGNIQLAVTLILSGLYYATLAKRSEIEAKKNYSTASQLAVISGLSNLLYNYTDSVATVGVAISSLGLMYGLMTLLAKDSLVAGHNLIGVGMILATGGATLTILEPWALLFTASALCIYSFMLWLKTKEELALSCSLLILLILPFIFGIYAKDISELSLLLTSSLSVLLVALCTYFLSSKSEIYLNSSKIVFIIGTIILTVLSIDVGFTALLITEVLVALSFVLIRYSDKNPQWWVLASLALTVPLVYSLAAFGVGDKKFVLAEGISLLGSILISLKTREQLTRWIVVGNILVAPMALGGGALGYKWDEVGYSFGYILAMSGSVLARAIARGKILVSDKVPVASYYKEASQAYVFGYITTSLIAIIVSLFTENSQIITSVVLAIILVVTVLAIKPIENDERIYLCVPILVQAIVLSSLRPKLSSAVEIGVTAVVCAVVGSIMTLSVHLINNLKANTAKALQMLSLATCYIGPFLALITPDHSLLLPVSLAIAGVTTTYFSWKHSQGSKELSVGVIIFSVHWFIYLSGVTNVQIHAHVLALFLALYALWRYARHDSKGVEGYLMAMFFTVTIPLALASLVGGDKEYGYLLIVEQVVFMTIGVLFKQKFLLKAGLWTGLAAVLFQLRGLGWAFLSILAVTIITIAVVRLQKTNDSDK